MAREITLNKKHLKYAGLLIALLLCVVAIDVFADQNAREASKAATESVTELFSVDLRRDVAGQLPPCTETGRAFWAMHLASIKDAAKARDVTVLSVKAERNGSPEPYKGIGGEGQIVPVKLTITSQGTGGRAETSESRVRVLMIKGEGDEWLLDGLAVQLPSR